jgi:serine/threonine-protein kinase
VTVPSTQQPSEDFARFAAALTGQYELECEIGRGGMGVVYRARDLRLDRRVAIKTLPPHLANDETVRERFLREARTAGGLSHHNIVPIHRADEIDGRVFFVMGYVDGGALSQRIRDSGRLSPRDVVRWLRDVAEALGYAHSRGVIHRDIKAENILLDGMDGRAMVTDFGIARLAEAAPLTSTGQLLGTVYYLSPEQISGDAVDARSDIYSLGVVGYFALSGQFPFDAPLASAVLISHVTKPAPPLATIAPRVPRALGEIVDRCLAKSPDDRYQDCSALVQALNDAVATLGVDDEGTLIDDRERAAAAQLVSDTEAQAIISRAASLQASTGIQPRPAPIIATRDTVRDAALTSGHMIGNVRDAAIEAGIDSKYVDHALVERGLGTSQTVEASRAQAGPLDIQDRRKEANAFLGTSAMVQLEVVIDGEMPDCDFDLLVDIVRDHTGESGQLSAIGRSLSWHSSPEKGNTHVSVLPRNGKTTIRVSETLRPAAGGFFGGMMGGLGGLSIPVWLGVGIRTAAPLGAIVLWGTTVGLGYLGARFAFSRYAARRDRIQHSLIEALAQQCRDSIAGAELDAGTRPSLPPGR